LKRIKVHILFWTFFSLYSLAIDYYTGEYIGVLAHFLYILTHHGLIFYATYCTIRYGASFERFRYLKMFLLFLGGFCFFIFVHFVFRIYIQKFLIFPFRPLSNYFHHFLYGITWYVQYFFMAAGFIFLESYKTSNEKLKISERQRLQTESNFLRAQINPHFLQNTLNFFYAQSITGKSDKLSEGILLLSDMMRYSLQNQGDSNARVPLQNEIQHLRNYISINQLRFNGQLQIRLHISGQATHLTIIPLVLVTLLENAFKHGELNDILNPLSVQLNIDDTAGIIRFEVINKIRTGPREQSTGIGIENTRRRLDTAYPGNYLLETGGQNGFYIAVLQINQQQLMAA
jgi:two-component system, LytTR family, sensor kinase